MLWYYTHMANTSLLPTGLRTIGVVYLLAGLGLLISTLYFTWSKVTITIIPRQQAASHEFQITVRSGEGTGDFTVSGYITQQQLEQQQTFTATGAESVSEESVGEVSMVNNYSKEQTLIATTRLTSPNDPSTVLVRLARTVVVQPGQTLKVAVYPDNPDAFKPISPQKFIIPGLWGPLQEYIYAENSETLEYGEYTVPIVTAADIENATKKLRDDLYAQGLSSTDDALTGEAALWPKLVTTEVNETIFDASAGNQTELFTGIMKLAATVIAFDENEVLILARQSLEAQTGGTQYISLDPSTLRYEIREYNREAGTALINVTVDASKAAVASPELLDRTQLLGKTADEIKAHYSQFSQIQEVRVQFSPQWLRKAPHSGERIKIQVDSSSVAP